jgi:DNA repair protein RadA/Sms
VTVQDYVCQSCGAVSSKWQGKCAACGTWNSLVQESASGPLAGPQGRKAARKKAKPTTIESLSAAGKETRRLASGMAELDRTVGGGFAEASAVLLSGEPGIGKSTLLLQAAASVAKSGHGALYFSGEESAQQIRLRARRLGLADAPLGLVAETCVERILATLDQGPPAEFVIIDSIQTLWSEALDPAPGTVSQVRAAMQALIAYAKARGAIIVVVGHVTKDGQIAGPKVIEHMVDTVLSFEGEGSHNLRLLRATKNRFGPSNEIGVFDMQGDGLSEVANPSELFLGETGGEPQPGHAVFAGIEGTRPLLVEIQALVAPTPFAAPRRAVVGWDQNRLSMLLAVLEARCGVRFSNSDVYLNVAGGLRVSEPAADIAAAAALLSAISGVPAAQNCVHFGEVGLSGTLRPVNQMALRLREAEKLGFRSALLPAGGDLKEGHPGLSLKRIPHLRELSALFPAQR